MNKRQTGLKIARIILFIWGVIAIFLYLLRTIPAGNFNPSTANRDGTLLIGCVMGFAWLLLYGIPSAIKGLISRIENSKIEIKRQTIIIWTSGIFISVFSLIRPALFIPILVMGSLLFWSFKDNQKPLTKRFIFTVILTIVGLIILWFVIWGYNDNSFWFIKPQKVYESPIF